MFLNRKDAGAKLASIMHPYRGMSDAIVLGMPRGGVPVAYELAKALLLPLDIFCVRKLDVPDDSGVTLGALASGDTVMVNHPLAAYLGVSKDQIDEVIEIESRELNRCENVMRRGRQAHNLKGKHVILVDDGLATGASMRAAAVAIRNFEPGKVIAAVPIASRESFGEFQNAVDEVFCLATPSPFGKVCNWYVDYSETPESEVQFLLDAAERGGLAA
ncbi:MAG: phosphoribosyltransferase [Leptolyngbya sp.]|nr:phosphoribosyltransferase [Candidatus Melainabacteria bacterium]